PSAPPRGAERKGHDGKRGGGREHARREPPSAPRRLFDRSHRWVSRKSSMSSVAFGPQAAVWVPRASPPLHACPRLGGSAACATAESSRSATSPRPGSAPAVRV